MREFTSFKRIYLCTDLVDGRKMINGLAAYIQLHLKLDPFEEALFIFCSKRRDTIKVLYFDRTGFALWMKRLEKARFPWPRQANAATMAATAHQLVLLLDGYDIFRQKPHQTLSFKQFV
jgi:transposase